MLGDLVLVVSSSHVRVFIQIFFTCDDLIPFFHKYEDLALIRMACEVLVPIIHICENLVPILHI